MMDSTTLNKQFAGYTGTTPRYMDFDKTSGKPLMMTEQANMYPTPYATMPMGGIEGTQVSTILIVLDSLQIFCPL